MYVPLIFILLEGLRKLHLSIAMMIGATPTHHSSLILINK